MKAAFFKLPVLFVVFVMRRVVIVHSTFCNDYYNERYKELRHYEVRCPEGEFWSPCCAGERTSIIERWKNYETLCPTYGELGELLPIKFPVI